MKKLLTVMIFALATQFALAQKFSIKGTVVDETGSGLPSATVMILSPKDSALVSFKGTNVEGAFEIVNVNSGTYLVKVTYVGYNNFFKTISAPQGSPSLEMGDLKLTPSSSELSEVVITGEANPVTVKRDTIEFSASSFKTQVNANVEDLLKKLPGVEVDNDGVVTAQGETVQQVLVDGREFFGRDPKLATRGLPADAVKSVQVFDKKSDQARFSGVDDGVRQKTINLELKEDRQNMTFGNVMGGGGADVKDNKLKVTGDEDGRFTTKASVNRFGKGKQLSIVGMGNNINEQGFTAADLGGAGGGGGGQGVATGIATNYAAGVNFNKDLSKKSKLTSNYFYNYTNRDLSTKTLQENPQGNMDQDADNVNTTNNHRANIRIDQELDSANSITVIATPSYTETRSNNSTQSTTLAKDQTTIAKTVDQLTVTDQTSTNLTSSLLWRHRFSRPGRTLSTNGSFAYTQADLNSRQTSNIQNFGVAQPKDQGTVQTTGNQTYGATVTYTEPLSAKNNKFLEATYDFSANVNQLDKQVNDLLDSSKPIASLTNKYNNTILVNRPYLSFRFTAPMYNISVGLGYQNTHLGGEFVLTNTPINYSFDNFLPAVRMNYDFTQFKHMRFNYQTTMTTPTFTQLNPVPDVSNQANYVYGNPDLIPSYAHSVGLNYTAFNPNKFINFFSNVNATYSLNPIVNSQTTNISEITDPADASKVKQTSNQRTTQPINVKNSSSLTANFNFGFPITPLKSRFNVGPNARYSKGITVNNTITTNTTTNTVTTASGGGSTSQTALGGTARYNLTLGTIYTLDLSANYSYSQTQYQDPTVGDQKFFNKIYQATSNLRFLKNYQFNSTFTYSMTNTISSNYKLNIPLLNVSFSRLLFKNQAGELKLGVNNLLNKSQSVQQTTDINTGSLTTNTYNNLGRYFMISFTYALNKNLNPAAGRGQGGPGGPGGFRD